MKLKALSSDEIYRLLNDRLTQELGAIRSVLKRADAVKLIAQDVSEVKSNVRTLQIALEAARDNSDASTAEALASLTRRVEGLDLTSTVNVLSSEVGAISAGLMEVMQKSSNTETQNTVDNEILQDVLAQIQALEQRIEYDKQRQLPYLALPTLAQPAPDPGIIFDSDTLAGQIVTLRKTVMQLIDGLIDAVNRLATEELQRVSISNYEQLLAEISLLNERFEEAFETQINVNDLKDV